MKRFRIWVWAFFRETVVKFIYSFNLLNIYSFFNNDETVIIFR